ncbi:flagellar FlbD family protein [Capnocytophaga canis]|uniref:flagellar FlbD family protein n=1 Tax=Capnocytophaga canis TaxID=1848903 RepID=UPI00370D292A
MFIQITTFNSGEQFSVNVHHIISVKGYPENSYIILANGDKISTPEAYHSLMARIQSAVSCKE